MGIAQPAQVPYGSAMTMGTPVMGVPEANGVGVRTTYAEGMMD